jgi:protein-histidine pros-kinase
MDDYISKPIHANEILRVLRDAAPSVTAVPIMPPSGVVPDVPDRERGSFDREGLFARMDGDRQAIVELVELLALDAPTYMRRLCDTIAAGDLMEAARVAHTLRGSVSHFGAHAAFELARRVEIAARTGTLTSGSDVTRRLEAEIVRLIADLKDWTEAARTGSPDATNNSSARADRLTTERG